MHVRALCVLGIGVKKDNGTHALELPAQGGRGKEEGKEGKGSYILARKALAPSEQGRAVRAVLRAVQVDLQKVAPAVRGGLAGRGGRLGGGLVPLQEEGGDSEVRKVGGWHMGAYTLWQVRRRSAQAAGAPSCKEMTAGIAAHPRVHWEVQRQALAGQSADVPAAHGGILAVRSRGPNRIRWC